MSFKVQLQRSGRCFDAETAETVLNAGLRQGYALPFGCRNGACGSCRVRLVEGKVEHAAPPRALSEAETSAGYVLMCLAHAHSDLTLDLHQPESLALLRPRTLPVRVAGHRALSDDVIELRVKLPRGEAFRWVPGQYVDFLLADGRRRSFSIANAQPADGTLGFHLRVTPGGFFTHYVQDDMPERAILRFEGPFGAFYVREDSARPVIMMAGGTGFSPIKAMLERQLARGLKRPFHLFWGARTSGDLYLHELASAWAQQHAGFRYTPVLSEREAGWSGETGFVHEAVLRAQPDLSGHEVYMAGPPVMVHAGKKAFVAAGLDADHLYYDSFDYAFETWPALG